MPFAIANLTNFKLFSAPLERPDFFFLGLPSVGLGKGKNVLVGRARRKTLSFFSFQLPKLSRFSQKKLSKKIQSYPKLSRAIQNYPMLSQAIQSNRELSLAIPSNRELSLANLSHPRLSSAILGYPVLTEERLVAPRTPRRLAFSRYLTGSTTPYG